MTVAEGIMFLLGASMLGLFWAFALNDLRRQRLAKPALAFMMVRWRLGRASMYIFLVIGAIAVPGLALTGVRQLLA